MFKEKEQKKSYEACATIRDSNLFLAAVILSTACYSSYVEDKT
jgi:hypothetical protein